MADSYRASDLPPGFEPDPALNRFPEDMNRRSGGFGDDDVVGSGKFRWCACRVFAVYRPDGRFGKVAKGGETVHLELLRPHCDYVTRKVFARHHVEWISDWLAKAGGFGYTACILPETEPMDVWDAANKFGLKLPSHYIRKREKTALAVANRGQRMRALHDRHGDSDAVRLARDVSRLVGR